MIQFHFSSKKWSKVFVHLKENNMLRGDMKDDELLLCLPGSTAFIERMFFPYELHLL
jgi:hypothetical protein